MRVNKKRLIFLLLSCLTATQLLAGVKIIHAERSMYRNIMVTEAEQQTRCIEFGKRKEIRKRQGCFYLNGSEEFVFNYTKMMMASLMLQHEPENILVIGLGSGTLPMALAKVFPSANVTSVEIDQAVLNVAEKFFNYQQSDKQKTYVMDGRVFIKRAMRKAETFDLILLDAFNGDYIPAHLMTKEFFTEIKSVLTDDGILAANTFATSRLFHHESVTYAQAFGQFYYVASPNYTGNRIILAGKKPLPPISSMHENLTELNKKVKVFGVDFNELKNMIYDEINWQTNARPLTDDYSPVNLMR